MTKNKNLESQTKIGKYTQNSNQHIPTHYDIFI